MSVVSKICYRLKLKNYFKKVECFLDDGYYTLNDKTIKRVNKKDVSFYRRFKVSSRNNKLTNYTSGNLFFTKYKSGLLTNDKAFYFINNKDRYESYKANYNRYIDRFVYPCINLEFVDDKMLVVAPIVKGLLIKDYSRFEIFLDKLFDFAGKSRYEYKDAVESDIKLPWYVQHGDCKNANIIWNEDNIDFTMIDLEAIDIYPPLYDVFYFLFITKKEESISILKSDEFGKKVKGFYSKVMKDVSNNILDITLANYAYYTSSKVSKGVELYEYEFYLFWRHFDSFDSYPLTQKVLKEYENKLKECKIKR